MLDIFLIPSVRLPRILSSTIPDDCPKSSLFPLALPLIPSSPTHTIIALERFQCTSTTGTWKITFQFLHATPSLLLPRKSGAQEMRYS